jgi:nucleotide-binding universal stress UspA family protein
MVALESAISDLRHAHRSVPAVVDVEHQWPAPALVDASVDASMLVVGRHAGHWRGRTHLGSVARAVLREASCPVMVVPGARPAEEPTDEGLEADEVSPQT